MKPHIIKILTFSVVGFFLVFAGIMAADRYAMRPGLKMSPHSDTDLARATAQPKNTSMPEQPGFSYRQGLSTGTLTSDGTAMVVKNQEFTGVADEPAGMVDMLNEMAGGNKKKPAPVRLDEKALAKPIMVDVPEETVTVEGADVPVLGAESTAASITIIKAPVDFKIFKTSDTWVPFAMSHKGKFPTADFANQSVLILVSMSEFPSGIFKIQNVTLSAGEIVVSYRVDPLAMSMDNEAREYEQYSAALIPKTKLPIRLEQVP